jgi:hypothetical protein
MDRDLILESLQIRLEDLEQDYRTTSDKLRNELDGSTQNRLKRELKSIAQQMTECEQDISARKQIVQVQAAGESINNLITILKNFENQLEIMVQVYAQTLAHWPVPVNAKANTVDDILTELARIAIGQSSYTALQEFVSHIVHGTSEPALSEALNMWGVQYHKSMDWLQLYSEIQAAQDNRLEDAQPAILITVVRSDEASTQSQTEERYYQINAWLVEDVETYKSQKTGYHALISTDSPEAQPCLLDELLQKITDLLQYFLSENNRLCKHCINEPQIHVFLPLELMNLSVDSWVLNSKNSRRQECIGHNHVVMLRCASRYEQTYTKNARWRKRWKLYRTQLQVSARDAFISGNSNDLDALREVLDEVVQDDNSTIVGLQVIQSPIDTEDLLYELLDSGLPLALWPRQCLNEASHETQLQALLASGCLEKLPHRVKAKRYETRRQQNTPELHIGHHLSLVWDDPDLVPPRSA